MDNFAESYFALLKSGQNSFSTYCILSAILEEYPLQITAQKMKFSIKDFFSQCDQIRRKLWIWSHLLKKSLMGNFIFCAVNVCCRVWWLRVFKNMTFLICLIWIFLFYFSVVKTQQSILRAKKVVLKKSLFIWKVLVTMP